MSIIVGKSGTFSVFWPCVTPKDFKGVVMVFMFFSNNFISKPTLEHPISKYRYVRLVGKY